MSNWRDIAEDQRLRLVQQMLNQQAEIIELKNQVARRDETIAGLTEEVTELKQMLEGWM